MKRGVMLINTGWGGLIHGKAVTGHQAWLTEDALLKIAEITRSNLTELENGRKCLNAVTEEKASQAHEWSEEEIERTLLAEQLQKWMPD
jgi:lactate dehydrogenase-like 2-hydroxyacid dehydrogenase